MNPAALFARLDETCLPEKGKVFGNGGGGEIDEGDQLADAAFTVAKGKEKPEAGGIGQGTEKFDGGTHGNNSLCDELTNCRRVVKGWLLGWIMIELAGGHGSYCAA